MPVPADPWTQVDDLDGRNKYRVLQISCFATTEEVKKAYRLLARQHHPDKGGDASQFSAIQDAFQTLSNRASRAIYDEWAKHLKFRYVPQRRDAGGEGILLDELEKAGITCDPRTQLVLLCEVCRRPSTKECWTCKMPICSFCTLKRHWKEGFPLHWPLIDSPHMQTQLAKRELEKKRLEDARLLDMEDPSWRSEAQLKHIRSFKVAASKMVEREDHLVCYDLALAKLYMWAQTSTSVHIAIHIPTGYEDRELRLDCNDYVLQVQPQDSPPVIFRAFDGRFDSTYPITSFRTKDNCMLVITLRKAEPGAHWPRLFRGDSDGARCLQPLYRIEETQRDVSIEANLPHWVDADDVEIFIGLQHLEVTVQGVVSCKRTYWQPREEASQKKFQAVDIEESMWSLDRGTSASGDSCTVLLINLLKPDPSEEEVTWKRGQREDNLSAERMGSGSQRGFRFFQDDEDEFGLEEIIQAVCFLEVQEAFVPAKPWEKGRGSRCVKAVEELPLAAQNHLKAMKQEAADICTND